MALAFKHCAGMQALNTRLQQLQREAAGASNQQLLAELKAARSVIQCQASSFHPACCIWIKLHCATLRTHAETAAGTASIAAETSACALAYKCFENAVLGDHVQVCCERNKDTVITTCWHTFCRPCIKKNLDTRHRKCPGCNLKFGEADVKTFYLT